MGADELLGSDLLDGRPVQEVDDILNVAELVEAGYTERIRAVNGWSRYAPDSCEDVKRVWIQVAIICLDNGFDPRDWVYSQVDQRRNPKPSMLLREGALDRMRAYACSEYSKSCISVMSQLSRLYGHMKNGRDVAEVLSNADEPFSNSFRYCFAVGAGISEIASEYQESARIQLLLRPQLKEALQSMTPASFDMEVLDDT